MPTPPSSELIAWLESTSRFLSSRATSVRGTARSAGLHIEGMLFVGPAGDRARQAVGDSQRGLLSVADELEFMSGVCRREVNELMGEGVVEFVVALEPDFPMIAVALPSLRPTTGPNRISLDPAGVVHTCAQLKFDANRCQEHQTAVTSHLGQAPRDLRPALRRRTETSRRSCSLALERAARRFTMLAVDLENRARTPGLVGEMYRPDVAELLALAWHGPVLELEREPRVFLIDAQTYVDHAAEFHRVMTLLVGRLPVIFGPLPGDWWMPGELVGTEPPRPTWGPTPSELTQGGRPEPESAAGGEAIAVESADDVTSDSSDSSDSSDASGGRPRPGADADLGPANGSEADVRPGASNGQGASFTERPGVAGTIKVIDPVTGAETTYLDYYQEHGDESPPPILVADQVLPEPELPVPSLPDELTSPAVATAAAVGAGAGAVISGDSAGSGGGGGGGRGGGGGGGGGGRHGAAGYVRGSPEQWIAEPVPDLEPAVDEVDAVDEVEPAMSSDGLDVAEITPTVDDALVSPNVLDDGLSSVPAEPTRPHPRIKVAIDGKRVDVDARHLVACGAAVVGVGSSGAAVTTKRARERVTNWATYVATKT